MTYDDHPFMSAQNLLDDAAGWAEELMLPPGHPDRCEEDPTTCLEQVISHLDSASHMLINGGTDEREVGEEFYGDYRVPIVQATVHDQVMVDAGAAIAELARPLRAWHMGGQPVEITDAVIRSLRDLLLVRFAERLQADQEAYQRDEDAFPG